MAVILPLVLILLVALVILIVLLLLRRRRSQGSPAGSDSSITMSNITNAAYIDDTIAPLPGHTLMPDDSLGFDNKLYDIVNAPAVDPSGKSFLLNGSKNANNNASDKLSDSEVAGLTQNEIPPYADNPYGLHFANQGALSADTSTNKPAGTGSSKA